MEKKIKNKNVRFYKVDYYIENHKKDKNGNYIIDKNKKPVKERKDYDIDIFVRDLKKEISKDKIYTDNSKESLVEIVEMGYNDGTTTLNINDADYIFCRMSCENLDNLQKRNIEDKTSIEIDLESDEYLEVFTYFCIFFEKIQTIIAYVATNHSLPVSRIERILTKNNNTMKIVPILARDVVGIIEGKDIVSKITYTTTHPSDKILSELGVTEELFEELSDKKSAKIEITLKSEGRNNSLFKDNKYLRKLIDTIKNKDRKAIKVTARNEDEKSKEYDILEQKLCASFAIDVNETDIKKRDLEYKQKILEVYWNNREELFECLR